ncbi:phosphate/phosphite/phosphonate ABC transporter substrate-binding protein [Gordonia sp. TBRC 11910]|uniref:Phosphate/phosphite/phosphonate ABC transporter substrate-binding protein n=1 Tax=Gordonia asplenii TaxID=2725283 RepID=A0A848KNY1_9ACTN|nr:phosphate/phosphite/phosphonate ABC transporter substrate-binding protein [Gordonia asplenii]
MGSVAYDPKVVTIWEGFRAYLRAVDGPAIDYLLYSNYERQVDDLLSGHIDLAWNSSLAWVRAERAARAAGTEVLPVFMRDTDRDLRSAVVVRADSELTDVTDLRGRRIAVGAVDSPQSTLLPLSYLRSVGVEPGVDVEVVRIDVGVGLHGDHVGGERDAIVALRDGTVDAACVLDANLLMFAREGTVASGALRVLGQTPSFDHCMMTAGPGVDATALAQLTEAFLAMSYADAQVRPLLDLEGLTAWLPGRTDGFGPLQRAVDESGFYDEQGRVRARDYRP